MLVELREAMWAAMTFMATSTKKALLVVNVPVVDLALAEQWEAGPIKQEVQTSQCERKQRLQLQDLLVPVRSLTSTRLRKRTISAR